MNAGVIARYYDPATAQFLTRDPAVSTTLSPYGYVAGDPINGSDPAGQSPADPDGPATCGSGRSRPRALNRNLFPSGSRYSTLLGTRVSMVSAASRCDVDS